MFLWIASERSVTHMIIERSMFGLNKLLFKTKKKEFFLVLCHTRVSWQQALKISAVILMMTDITSTRTVLQALRLCYRYTIDVKSQNACWLTCQETLYSNSEQRNTTPEAKWQKTKTTRVPKRKSTAAKQSRITKKRFRKVNSEVKMWKKDAIYIQKIQNVQPWKCQNMKVSCFEKKPYFQISTGDFSEKNIFNEYFCQHPHPGVALYNPPPTADQTWMPLEQIGGLNTSLQDTPVVVSLLYGRALFIHQPLSYYSCC